MVIMARAVRSEMKTAARVSSEQVWQQISKASFAVISYVTGEGRPRSSGVVYKASREQIYVAVAPYSWKAKHITTCGEVSVTVPVRRGGVLSLLYPIPPATISFHGSATVHPPGSPELVSLLNELGPLLPPGASETDSIIEVTPFGEFLVYGLGVALLGMRDPAASQARVPIT